MIKDFLIINCTGQDDKVGLKIKNNFFIHNFEKKTKNNDIIVLSILNLFKKHKTNIEKNFTVIVNCGPGSFSTLRVALAVAKGISISKNIRLFGYNDKDLPQFSPKNIDVLIKKNLIEKKLIKLLYLS